MRSTLAAGVSRCRSVTWDYSGCRTRAETCPARTLSFIRSMSCRSWPAALPRCAGLRHEDIESPAEGARQGAREVGRARWMSRLCDPRLPSAGRQVGRSEGRKVGRSAGRKIGRSEGRKFGTVECEVGLPGNLSWPPCVLVLTVVLTVVLVVVLVVVLQAVVQGNESNQFVCGERCPAHALLFVRSMSCRTRPVAFPVVQDFVL